MLERLVDKYIRFQTERGLLLNEEKGVYRYGYILLLETFINCMVSLLIGLVMKDMISVLIFLFTFIPLRSYAGGYHADKVWKCILLSNFCIVFVILLARVIDMLNYVNVLKNIDVFIDIIIFLLSPVDSDKKTLSNNERKVYKRIVFYILAFQVVFSVLLSDRAEIVALAHIIIMVSICQQKKRNVEL